MYALQELLLNDNVTVTEVRFTTYEVFKGINTEFLVSSWMLTFCDVFHTIREVYVFVYLLFRMQTQESTC